MSTTTERQLSLRMGCLSPKFVEQLKDQGLKFKDLKDGEHLQAAADSVSSLSVSGLATEAEVHKIRQRILKQVVKSVVLCEAP